MNFLHNLSSHHNLMAIPGSLVAGIITYAVMSIFFIPSRITIPEATVVSVLVFGLTKYYAEPNDRQLRFKESYVIGPDLPRNNNSSYVTALKDNMPISGFVFVGIYVILLIIISTFPHSSLEIFLPWKYIPLLNLIQLGASIALCFFFPGYAVILVVDKANKLRPILRGVLAYILSMFISGFTGYVLALLGFPLLDMQLIFVDVYGLALLPFAALLFWKISSIRKKIVYTAIPQKINISVSTFFRDTKKRVSLLLIFGSVLTLIILSTYSLYGGIIVGDQWFHHGRSLEFIYGGYSHLAASGMEYSYPPFLSALFAVFFILAGNIPSVNSYASIGFLNVVPVIAFYYFFTSWISGLRTRKAAILATVFFLLSAGFGWVFALDIALNHPLTSQLSALQSIFTASKQTFDIRSPSTFVLVSHPEVTTGLQLIALPVGFVLLGLIKEATKNRQIKLCAIVFVITTLAILSHDEIYLFIIIASILPLVFRLPDRGYLYAGLICSILVTVLLDTLLPGEYSESKFFGMPLQILCLIFTAIMGLLYSGTNLLRRVPFIKSTLPNVRASRLIFVVGIAFTVSTAFLYTFTYLVWASLSFKEIQLQVSTNNVPWYLYPLKMGLMGVLGLAFVVSYVFRKFEKEVFVFGIISLVALFLGPYYDEHRFSKYVMVGLIGLASLLVCELISYIERTHFKPLFTGIIIGCILVISSFSTLMYIGFQASALDTNNLDLLWEGRRNFPSSEVLHMLQFLQHENINSTQNSNVITFASEYQTKSGLLGKLQGFSGVPLALLLKEPAPLALNASTLEALYSDLVSSDGRYILLPKKEIQGAGGEAEKLSNILRFVYDHFQKVYEDNNFVILYIPPQLATPSSTADIALLYDPRGFLLSSMASEKLLDLPFNNTLFFENKNNSDALKFEADKNNLILYGENKTNTLWSKPLQLQNTTNSINVIEGSFQFIGKNSTRAHNDCGITWDTGQKKYYAYMRDDKLGLRITPFQENQSSPENNGLKWKERTWYTLRIILEREGARIYVDDSLKLQVPGNFMQDNPVTKVGARCSGGIAEFQPMRVGENPKISNNSLQQRYDTFHHFYPLSGLALSKLPYDTLIDNDSSAYSAKNLILTNDSSNQEAINKYLEVVRRGGTLVVMDTNNSTHQGGFSKMLSLSKGNSTQFDSIAVTNNNSNPIPVPVSGFARQIDFKPVPNNITIISSYLNNNKQTAPFAIEKRYDNGGRIIFVNLAGYFDALYKSPKKYFPSLRNIAELVNISTDKSHPEKGFPDMISDARYVGNMSASGHTVIKSSSFEFLDNSNNSYAQEITILSGIENRNYSGQPLKAVTYENVSIEKMKLYGQYRTRISSDGLTLIPSPYSTSSQFDYVAVSIPTGSNITIELTNGSKAEFQLGNQTGQFSFATNGTIRLQNIKSHNPEVDSSMVLVKKPEFTVDGNVSFESLYRGDDFYLTKDVYGVPANLSNVKLNAVVDHVDNYEVAGKNGEKIDILTYLKSLNIDENRTDELNLKIPGEISDSAKAEGMEVPWKKIITSYPSIGTLLALGIAVFLTWLLWPRIATRFNEK